MVRPAKRGSGMRRGREGVGSTLLSQGAVESYSDLAITGGDKAEGGCFT